ncbi:MAG: chromosome segregation protein SMC [Aquisalimonadaceae bacterium]
MLSKRLLSTGNDIVWWLSNRSPDRDNDASSEIARIDFMRLKKIRLAGFKSFVDPTTVNLPGPLVGIVGPNGCGKSNVIDAVRWVMGESSARHLRGESMTDVIFNGSSSRKPVSQASIELVFDNTDGTIGGQYASYAEISVKRQVNRDGQSQYFLNGTRCRRRDVTDVFLGTGLGPRSYSIIEQGMISRIIEAKPEELRVYLEEAAGISLYKERRRETERRIRDTRENMDRLNDVREEVGVQLEKLKRQAQTAERYKTLKQEERQLRAELLALRLRELTDALSSCDRDLQGRETALEGAISRQRGSERGMVAAREQQTEFGEQLNVVQGQYYGLGSDIARLEQQITHHRELGQRRAEDLAASTEALSELERTLADDREKRQVLESRLEDLRPELEEADALEAEASDQVIESQQALDDWQAAWDDFNEQAAGTLQEAQVERTRIEHLEQRQQEFDRRRERLSAERDALDPVALEDEIEEMLGEELALGEQRDRVAEELQHLETRLAEIVEQEQEQANVLQDLRGDGQKRQAQLTSLDTLQQNALAESDGPVADWLNRYGLDGAGRLAHALSVDAGWEVAVETVLADRLQTVCVDGVTLDAEALSGLSHGDVTLLDTAREAGAPAASVHAAPRLLDCVRAPWALEDLLGGIYCADSLEQATALRDALGATESVVTPDGHWLGRRWYRITGDGDQQHGVLAREREIAHLRERLESDGRRIEEQELQLRELRERRLDLDEDRQRLQDERDQIGDRLSALRGRRESRQHRLDDVRERHDRLAEEIEDTAEQSRTAGESIREARGRLQEALDRGEAFDVRRAELQEARESRQQAVTDAREIMRQRRELRHELLLKLENAGTAREAIVEQVARLESQRARLTERAEELRAVSEAEGDPTVEMEQEREQLLRQRLEAERQLNEARSRLGEVDQRLRELEQARVTAENEADSLRQELEAARLHQQELRVRRQTQAEQLAELGYDLDTLQRNLPEQADERTWLQRLADVENRINRLGSINLAAIEEHETLAERKGYLDQQYDDLNEALETLDTAIRRIDRETRARFKDTFDRVNAGLSRMYPRLFGGGEAYLELTGEDLLDTGVTILARPPGKRITNIHLLSGGEKAMTAVALIFAIFELNPAPFCMLDEVDAPLDEANVGRFGQLVQEMSNRVQFIFITHNKSTMEIATHLMGVTMHEAGVSRLVAVDVDEAAEMVMAV